jgi:hypothetical protein
MHTCIHTYIISMHKLQFWRRSNISWQKLRNIPPFERRMQADAAHGTSRTNHGRRPTPCTEHGNQHNHLWWCAFYGDTCNPCGCCFSNWTINGIIKCFPVHVSTSKFGTHSKGYAREPSCDSVGTCAHSTSNRSVNNIFTMPPGRALPWYIL